jgi:hypothetical protein
LVSSGLEESLVAEALLSSVLSLLLRVAVAALSVPRAAVPPTMVVVSWLASVGRVASTVMLATMAEAEEAT